VISNARTTFVSCDSVSHRITSADGRAEIDVPSGTCKITVKAPGFLDKVRSVSINQAFPISIDFELAPDTRRTDDFAPPVLLEPTLASVKFPALEVLVLDQSGAVISGADLRFRSASLLTHVTTGSTGYASIELPPDKYEVTACAYGFLSQIRQIQTSAIPDSLPKFVLHYADDGQYDGSRVPLIYPDHSPKPVTKKVGDIQEIGAVLSLSGSVTDDHAKPLPHVLVDEVSADWERNVATVESDAEGHFTLHSPLAQAEYNLRFSRCSFGPVKVHVRIDKNHGKPLKLEVPFIN
jgi:hypothetical protein